MMKRKPGKHLRLIDTNGVSFTESGVVFLTPLFFTEVLTSTEADRYAQTLCQPLYTEWRKYVMRTKQLLSLVDYLAYKARCTYVSDLHYLGNARKLRIAHELEKLDSDVFPLHEWNDALEYLAGVRTPCSSAEQAKTALIEALSAPRSRRWSNAKVLI